MLPVPPARWLRYYTKINRQEFVQQACMSDRSTYPESFPNAEAIRDIMYTKMFTMFISQAEKIE